MNNIDDLIVSKSVLLLDIEHAKRERKTKKVVEMASEAAALERNIADLLVRSGDREEAVVNLVSAASCFVDARRQIEARRVLELALHLAEPPSLRSFVQSSLESLQSIAIPGRVFFGTQPRIQGNALLRRPQVEAYEAAKNHFLATSEHAIIQLPVGCGKTGTMSLLPFGISKGRALVVAPGKEIAGNLRKNFDYSMPGNFLSARKVLVNGHGPTCAVLDERANVADADASDFVIANIQQLVASRSKKWLAKFPSDYFDIILFDEGHHNAADSWKAVQSRFPDAKFASFTATPLRADGKKVEGKRIYRFPIGQAIREGFVKNIASRRLEPSTIEFTYNGSTRKHSLAEVVKLRDQDWFSKGVALSPECNRNIVDAAIQCMQELRAESPTSHKHQIIAAACSIDHAQSIRSLFRERSLSAEVLHSDLPAEKQEKIRSQLEAKTLDVVVHVQMLGEGADYPSLSVAAIFRPYRHLVPYIQFVGRVMRVVHQNQVGHLDNRGFVVSHVGLHIDRWWEELRELDKDDQLFFEAIAKAEREFDETERAKSDNPDPSRRRFAHPMQVLNEQIEQYVQEHFLDPNDAAILVDDLVHAMELRGFGLELLGLTREQIAERLLNYDPSKGQVAKAHVQPQRLRQEAQRRLDERVKAGAKQLLNELGISVAGRRLVRLFPEVQAKSDLAVAIILLNKEVSRFLGVGRDERGLLTTEQLRTAHDSMDGLIDTVAEAVRPKLT